MTKSFFRPCSFLELTQIDYEEYTRSNNIESKEDVAAKIIEADMDSQTDYEESKGIESSADSSIKNGSEMSSIEEASKLNDDYVQYTNSDNRDDAAKTTEADMEEISTHQVLILKVIQVRYLRLVVLQM